MEFVVPYTQFVEQISKVTGLSLNDYEVVKELFGKFLMCVMSLVNETKLNGNTKDITIFRFDRVVANFGDILSPDIAKYSHEIMKKICTDKSFHGEITRDEAVERLASAESGSYLVRVRNPKRFCAQKTNIKSDSEAGFGFAVSYAFKDKDKRLTYHTVIRSEVIKSSTVNSVWKIKTKGLEEKVFASLWEALDESTPILKLGLPVVKPKN